MALGALDAGRPLLIAVLVASALLSVTYLMPLTHLAYFKKNERGDFQQFREANLWMLIPMVIIAAICIILGTVPNAGPHLYEITQIAAQAIFH